MVVVELGGGDVDSKSDVDDDEAENADNMNSSRSIGCDDDGDDDAGDVGDESSVDVDCVVLLLLQVVEGKEYKVDKVDYNIDIAVVVDIHSYHYCHNYYYCCCCSSFVVRFLELQPSSSSLSSVVDVKDLHLWMNGVDDSVDGCDADNHHRADGDVDVGGGGGGGDENTCVLLLFLFFLRNI